MRLIDADALKESMEKAGISTRLIDAAPTIDPDSLIPHGRWTDVFECSNCNVVTEFKGDKRWLPDFVCPNCGAKMDEED